MAAAAAAQRGRVARGTLPTVWDSSSTIMTALWWVELGKRAASPVRVGVTAREVAWSRGRRLPEGKSCGGCGWKRQTGGGRCL